MSVDLETHKFSVPQRAVFTPADIEKWEKSEAYQDLIGFILAMTEAVRGKGLSCSCHESENSKAVMLILNKLNDWVDEIPPIDQPQRFGNKAFREYYSRVKENGEDIIKSVLPSQYHNSVPEITVYLVESLGNSTRIDYGTGHELAFAMFLTCLFKIGALEKEDSVAIINKIFKMYMELVRKLQITYKMEPAGSQGVWSLDDYQFLPFIWGASQLQMNPKITPEMFTNEKVVDQYADEYLFMACVKFIMSVKTGPFAEHSNQLWNISAVQTWGKINQGLVKMYKAEVLSKFPVIQHVLFGSLLTIDQAKEIRFLPQSSGLKMPPPGCSIPRHTSGSMPCPGAMPPPLQMRTPLATDCKGMGNLTLETTCMPAVNKGSMNTSTTTTLTQSNKQIKLPTTNLLSSSIDDTVKPDASVK